MAEKILRNVIYKELKTINKQINALLEEIGKLKSDIRHYASLNRDSIRDYHEMVLGDLD